MLFDQMFEDGGGSSGIEREKKDDQKVRDRKCAATNAPKEKNMSDRDKTESVEAEGERETREIEEEKNR